jgi:hypothetical protein
MLNRTMTHFLGKWLAIAAMLGFGLAMAQTTPNDPTLKQIYEAAQAGQLDKAQGMVQQVLVLHPNSAKAHFVQAELFARQGQLPKAREALATADKLAPGLPFAKSEAIQSLRAQLDGKSGAPAVRAPTGGNPGGGNSGFGMNARPPAAPASSTPWGMILALGGAAIAFGVFLVMRKKTAPPSPYGMPQAAPFNPANAANPVNPAAMQGGGLSGPQSFGMGAGAAAGNPAYGQPPAQPYGQAYGQPPAGSGMGGRLAGGLATGLAVGAGMMAAQAIGKTLTANEDRSRNTEGAAGNSPQSFTDNAGTGNNDMGGQNFGVEDAGSWDDAGAGGDMGGGGDWDT